MREARLLQHTDPLWITDEIIADHAHARPGRLEGIAIGIEVASVLIHDREQAGGIKLSVAVLVTIISKFVGTRRNAETVSHEDRRTRGVIEILEVLQHLCGGERLTGRIALI